MSTLRLYWHSGPLEPGLPWALRDDEGRVLAAGEPGDDWPDCAAVELILSAGRTRFGLVTLPEGVRLDGGVALGFALEESLINAPAENLYLAGQAADDDRHWVALTAAAPLLQARAWLAERGRSLMRIVPEEMLLPPPPPGGWTLAHGAHGYVLRLGRERGGFVPAGAEALLDGMCAGAAPQCLLLCGELALPQALAALARQTVPAHDWRRAPALAATDFARGALAAGPGWADGRAVLQKLGLLLLLLICLEWGLDASELGWLHWRQARLQRQIALQAAACGVSAASPRQTLARMGRQLELRRLEQGLPGRYGALELMSALDQAADAELRLDALDYRDGQLGLEISGLAEGRQALWRQRLAWRGLRLERDAAGQWLLTPWNTGEDA